MRERVERWAKVWLVPALLLVFGASGYRAAERASVTFDEFAHIPAGVAYWKQGAFHIYPHNPPLARLICTLPILGSARLPAISPVAKQDPEYRWEFAEDFLLANLEEVGTPAARLHDSGRTSQAPLNPRYDGLVVQARLAILLLGVLLGGLIFLWCRSLFGTWGGVLSLSLYAFCPNMLAHASLATTDLAAAFFATLAMFALHEYGRRPGTGRLLMAGAALGLAALTKFTNLLLLLPAAVFLLTPQLMTDRGSSGRQGQIDGAAPGLLPRSAVCLGSAWFIFCAGYFFTGLFTPLGDIPLHSGVLRAVRGAVPPWLPLPVPPAALMGVDAELVRSANHLGIFYLLGELSREGWLTYIPIAMLVKVPLPVLILWGCSIPLAVQRFMRARDHASMAALFAPPVVLLLAFTVMTGTNYGLRYVLVSFPFLFVLSGITALHLDRRWKIVGLLALMTWHLAGSAAVSPHYLTYFNELVGGPRSGIDVLADSNLDWGQQLKELKRYMDGEGLEEIALSYTGPVDPWAYGIRWRPLKLGETRGLAAVSANHLVGYFPMGGVFGGGIEDLTRLRSMEPEAVLGHSMFIYRLEGGEGNRASSEPRSTGQR